MIDLEKFIGVHEWQTISVGDNYFCVPDLNWCARVLILVLCVYFLIKGIMRVTSLVSR